MVPELCELARIETSSTLSRQGDKLPLLIIVKETPGGDIERFDVPTYPAGPVYAVQEKAYMDQRVWSMYLREVLKPAIDCPSVVLADN
ncbi:hypothetical protein DYB25_009473 [Aphanomyces astaci]|uniref:DDE-1 domain-containing protein n=1 Tax=Aphanomyces astaci TaxID=112090 RepID=A0A397EYX2_APHAT|nr:hypothetical protein DYB25_009473 [Aphanomyces astaci]RHY69119.1 hypothetical protein DYB30_013298 [Aphanomyces astaci]RHZ02957.1 hypothetical protein DYB31_013621 [Aphanomyces astaci]RHZ07484.1 hypothetical protein DYB26_013857 [Aphanomyces astaci]